MDDRDIKRIGIVLGLGLLAFAILGQAFQAGVAVGLARDGEGGAVGPVHGPGFFPFPPLLLLVIGLVLFLAWRRRWIDGGPGGQGRGPGGGRPPRLFEEWHRRAHEAEAEQRSNGSGGAASAAGGQSGAAAEGGPTEGRSV